MFPVALRFFTLSTCAFVLMMNQAFAEEFRPNVLLIIVDDLAPVSVLFGGSVETPSLNELATRGVAFRNNYANVPVCGASRASMLTGLSPTSSRFLSYNSRVDKDVPGALTLPGHFRANGWYTAGNGKIFDVIADSSDSSWSEPVWSPASQWYGKPVDARGEHLQSAYIEPVSGPRRPWAEKLDVPDNAYPDGQVAEKTAADIQRLAVNGKPFFLAVGFRKPHLPFTAPAKYWRESAVDHLPDTWTEPGQDIPDAALHRSLELRMQYDALPLLGDPSDKKAADIVAGYHAAVRYADAQVGKVLRALDESNVANNTIVVLMGDHGFLLAEQRMWTKHALFEPALRTPLIVVAPSVNDGIVVDTVTDLLDVFPTLTDLAGINTPAHLQGSSLKTLINNPAGANAHKSFSISQWMNGESIRDARYRYTRWFDADNQTLDEMLFDLVEDPNEEQNIVERRRDVADGLRAKLDSKRDEPIWSDVLDSFVSRLGTANSTLGGLLLVVTIYPMRFAFSALFLAFASITLTILWRRKIRVHQQKSSPLTG
jgi:iduronate 2-sulfatase